MSREIERFRNYTRRNGSRIITDVRAIRTSSPKSTHRRTRPRSFIMAAAPARRSHKNYVEPSGQNVAFGKGPNLRINFYTRSLTWRGSSSTLALFPPGHNTRERKEEHRQWRMERRREGEGGGSKVEDCDRGTRRVAR